MLFATTVLTKYCGSTTGGNTVFLHLFIDALALQPCNPTCECKFSALCGFGANAPLAVVDARNAWIQADINRYNGANYCLLWRTFASRGLGVNAALHIDDTSVPVGC